MQENEILVDGTIVEIDEDGNLSDVKPYLTLLAKTTDRAVLIAEKTIELCAFYKDIASSTQELLKASNDVLGKAKDVMMMNDRYIMSLLAEQNEDYEKRVKRQEEIIEMLENRMGLWQTMNNELQEKLKQRKK